MLSRLSLVLRCLNSKRNRTLRIRKASVWLMLAAVFAMQVAPVAQATTYYWDTTVTGTWATGANWSTTATTGGATGIVPTVTDLAVFNQSSVNGAETVQLGAPASVGGVTFVNTGTT